MLLLIALKQTLLTVFCEIYSPIARGPHVLASYDAQVCKNALAVWKFRNAQSELRASCKIDTSTVDQLGNTLDINSFSTISH